MIRTFRPSVTAIVLGMMALLVACSDSRSIEAADHEHQRGFNGVVMDPPIARPDFKLTDVDGNAFDFREQTEGKLALLFIGYTYCPDICPVHMASIASVFKRFPELASQARVIFITADPERDTPERLKEWLGAFHPEFVGLRGTIDEVHEIERSLNVPQSFLGEPTDGNYAVGHASQVIAFTPDGLGRVVFPFGTRQSEYAQDLPRLVNFTWEET